MDRRMKKTDGQGATLTALPMEGHIINDTNCSSKTYNHITTLISSAVFSVCKLQLVLHG